MEVISTTIKAVRGRLPPLVLPSANLHRPSICVKSSPFVPSPPLQASDTAAAPGSPSSSPHSPGRTPRCPCPARDASPRNPRPSAMRSRLLLPLLWRSRAPPPRQRHHRDRPLPPRAPHAQPPPRERCPMPRPSTTRSSSPPTSVTAFSAVASASTPSPRSTSTISSPRTSPPYSTSAVTTPMGSSSPVRSRRSTPGWFCRWRAPHPARNPRLRRRSPSFAQRLSSPKPPRTPHTQEPQVLE